MEDPEAIIKQAVKSAQDVIRSFTDGDEGQNAAQVLVRIASILNDSRVRSAVAQSDEFETDLRSNISETGR